MTEIGFYHLTKTSLPDALLRLLEKILASGKRVVVRTGSVERVKFLNDALWTIDAASFLPPVSYTHLTLPTILCV